VGQADGSLVPPSAASSGAYALAANAAINAFGDHRPTPESSRLLIRDRSAARISSAAAASCPLRGSLAGPEGALTGSVGPMCTDHHIPAAQTAALAPDRSNQARTMPGDAPKPETPHQRRRQCPAKRCTAGPSLQVHTASQSAQIVKRWLAEITATSADEKFPSPDQSVADGNLGWQPTRFVGCH
jgi:hypothetical protein